MNSRAIWVCALCNEGYKSILMQDTRKTQKLHEIWEIRPCESVIYSCSLPPKHREDDANRMWEDLWIFMSRCSSAGVRFELIGT